MVMLLFVDVLQKAKLESIFSLSTLSQRLKAG
jgi:hypothetical protein